MEKNMKGIFLPTSASWRGSILLVAACGAVLCVDGLAVERLAAQESTPPAEIAPATPPVEQPSLAAEQPPASPELADAIKRLDDNQYAVRQAAQRQLVAIGSPALEATAQVAASGSLESATRAVNVLWKWSESNDKGLSRAALEKIAALANRPVEAADAQRRLAVLRELEAIDAIVKLGGQVEADRSFGLMGGDGAPLQVIVGKNWKGGVDGLKHVADVRRATTLSLWSAPLDDEAMPRLSTLKNLRRIELYGLQLTPELVDQVREKLPNTMVEVRGPARLGIRGLDAIEIVPNSPAAKAGLVVHDRITEFNGTKIETFEQLTAEIGKCKAGDSVDIKFLRGTETREAKVTFDAWGDDVGTRPAPVDAPAAAQGLFGPIPRPAPRQMLPRVQIERRPLGTPGAIPAEPADPKLPR
jgi:hypothetical protein